MSEPDIDWLCARYPSLSEAIVIAVCSEYDTEAEAEQQLRRINPNLTFDCEQEDNNDNEIVGGEADEGEMESESAGEELTDFEKRLETLIKSHQKDKGKEVGGNSVTNGTNNGTVTNNNGTVISNNGTISPAKAKKPAQKPVPQAPKSPKKAPLNGQKSPQKNHTALHNAKKPAFPPKNFAQEISDISELLGLPYQRVERVYHWKQIKTDPQRTIIELVVTEKTHPPTPTDMEVIENTELVFQTIPWPVIVRLCLFAKGDGEKAFQIAEKISDFGAWDSLIIPDVEGIEQSLTASPEAEEQPAEFTRVGDKASTEKVKASMSLSQQSQQYDELQNVAKTNLLNTTDPALRHEFKKTYEELKDKNQSVKQRIAKLTEPQNETLWYTDLHGLYVPEAMRVAKVKIESWWEVEKDKDKKDIRPLTLNTGLGSHSSGGFSKIKVALTKWLSIEGWIHEVHKGHIQVVRK
ncbi:hypothetical protein CJU90_4318 [Yarrowia sp. C11]|nr:hypothetical protein CKK34_6601 [Yarrowia sp. E02]KAG5365253.1 hypothetical protein CJU90_4318 [Yarrowia sp. C11]